MHLMGLMLKTMDLSSSTPNPTKHVYVDVRRNMDIPKVRKLSNNCYIIHVGDTQFLQSYDTTVARQDASGFVTLDPTYKHSRTTYKHVNMWLGEPALKLLKTHRATITNLNV